jgi:hypothetical protein
MNPISMIPPSNEFTHDPRHPHLSATEITRKAVLPLSRNELHHLHKTPLHDLIPTHNEILL